MEMAIHVGRPRGAAAIFSRWNGTRRRKVGDRLVGCRPLRGKLANLELLSSSARRVAFRTGWSTARAVRHPVGHRDPILLDWNCAHPEAVARCR